MHESIELDYILFNMHSDYKEGWCIECGAEVMFTENCVRNALCPKCGALQLFGSFALCELLTGIPAPCPPEPRPN